MGALSTMAIVGGSIAAASATAGVVNALAGGADPKKITDKSNVEALRAQEQGALARQDDFAQAVANQQGLSKMGATYDAYGNLISAPAPDVAGAQLAEATGQNIAGQTAMMAGARGVAANPALLARQIAQQGGMLQQQAVGQAQTLRLQQERDQNALRLNALQGQGALASNLGALQANAVGASTAARQNAARAGESAFLTQEGQQMQADLGKQQAIGGALSGLSQAGLKMATMNEGGEVPDLETFLSTSPAPKGTFRYGGRVPGKPLVSGDHPKNDFVPAMLSPGEIVIPRSKARDPKKAAQFAAAVARRSKRRR